MPRASLWPLACLTVAAFIEDFQAEQSEPYVDFLIGAGRSPEKQAAVVRFRSEKEVWMRDIGFDFAHVAAQVQESVDRLLSKSSVKIYVHQVPQCSLVVEDFTSKQPGFGWDRAVQLHAMHIKSLHDAIMNSGVLTTNSEEATSFYIPAPFSLLIEKYIDSGFTIETLNCISSIWDSLPAHLFHRNAGYDHFIVAGTCFPYSMCDAAECDITAYHPFAVNVMSLVGGLRHFGHPEFTFRPRMGYQHLSTIIVPFPVTLDCQRLLQLGHPDWPRATAVAFVGTENSRVRSIVRKILEERAENGKVYINVLPETEGEDGEATRRAAFGLAGRPIDELYADSEFCLILPGHVYDLGRRAYDAMARACIPVIVSMAPMFVSLPFESHIPWTDFALFASVRHEEDANRVLDSLLQAAEDKAAVLRRREVMLRHLPKLFLPPHEHCLPGTPSAVDGILKELAVRQVAWSGISIPRSMAWSSPGELFM